MEDPVKTVVVKRDDMPSSSVATTPTGTPDLIVRALSPARIVVTRVARVYVQSLVGMLTVVMSGIASDALITPGDFGGKLYLAAGLAIAPATVTLLQNALELLTKLDETKPELRA